MKQFWQLVLSTLIVLTFSACGGGDDSKSEDKPTPKPVVENKSPIANAGSDINATQGDKITLDGSKSSDSDGSIVKYEWFEGEKSLYLGKSYVIDSLEIGKHTIILKVTDNQGKIATDDIVVIVNKKDVEQEPIEQKNVARFLVDIPSNVALSAYEVVLKYKDRMPAVSDIVFNENALRTNARSVFKLSPKIDSNKKIIRFGLCSYGNGDGIQGRHHLFSISTLGKLSNIEFAKIIFLDKDANEIPVQTVLQ